MGKNFIASTMEMVIASKSIERNVIMDILLKYLYLLNNSKVDNDNSSCTVKNGEISIELISINEECLRISILVWRDFINIYIGKFEIQFSDDARIVNKKDQVELIENLNLLFHSQIEERLLVVNEKVKAYEYSFFVDSSVKTLFKGGVINQIENSQYKKYNSWVS